MTNFDDDDGDLKLRDLPSMARKGKKPPKGAELAAEKNRVTVPKFRVMSVRIRNESGSPLVVHAFSQKQIGIMRDKQVQGSTGKKGGKRAGKDFEELFNGARYLSVDGGWDGVPSITFRHSIINAFRLLDMKMVLGKLSIFIENDGNSRSDGTPLVRIYGKPVPFEAPVRNFGGVADIRVRPRYDKWHANLRIRFDADVVTPDDLISLLMRAGGQVGICEGRNNSSKSFGMGWGSFEIDPSIPIMLTDVPPQRLTFITK